MIGNLLGRQKRSAVTAVLHLISLYLQDIPQLPTGIHLISYATLQRHSYIMSLTEPTYEQ